MVPLYEQASVSLVQKPNVSIVCARPAGFTVIKPIASSVGSYNDRPVGPFVTKTGGSLYD